MKKKNILAICISLPFLLGGAYYLNNMFDKYNESRLQACQERQKEIVKAHDIYEAILAKKAERQRIKDGIEPTEKLATKKQRSIGGYITSSSPVRYPQVEGVDPCTWLHREHKMRMRTSVATGT